MELRTKITIDKSAQKINYQSPALFIGSCFASEIGTQMEEGKLPVMVNPAGPVYNPVSVANTLDFIIKNKKFDINDLYNNDGEYLSFYHYTDFDSENSGECLSKINETNKKAHDFLAEAKFLFITFGTARIFKFRFTGEIVSNCHKLPAGNFSRELLTVTEIVKVWGKTLAELKKFNKQLNIIFTVSPVRHWKDGAHGNQISKSVLFLAIEELLKDPVLPLYFPAYELLIDDLRDYRFYADDMLHPSQAGVDYIWEAFSECFIENKTIEIWREVVKITKARNHRIAITATKKVKTFAERMINQISTLEEKYPFLSFAEDRNYFLDLLH